MLEVTLDGRRRPRPIVSCINHPDKRAHARGLCSCCYVKKYYADHVEYRSKSMDRATQWRKDNPEKAKAIKDKSRAKTCPVKAKDRMLKRKYGITVERFEQMFAEQGGVCFICEKTPANNKSLHVDHCHKTGRVRGILCHHCNWYLGKIENDPTLMDRLLRYLEFGAHD